MAHGYPDYTFFYPPISVPYGGTGWTNMTANSLLCGNGTQPVLLISSAGFNGWPLLAGLYGGPPAYNQLDLGSNAVVGILPVAEGGWGQIGYYEYNGNIKLQNVNTGQNILLAGGDGGSLQIAATVAINKALSSYTLDIGGSLNWSTPQDGCKLINSTAHTVANNTPTNLLWDTEIYDYGSMHSTSSNTDRITINRGGVYVVTGIFECSAPNAGRLNISIQKNTYTTVAQCEFAPDAGSYWSAMPVFLGRLNAGDYLQLQMYNTTGVGVTATSATEGYQSFGAQWIGP